MGTGFDLSLDGNIVTIGGTNCTVIGASESQINCTIGQGRVGRHKVIVNVNTKGLAEGHVNFTNNFHVASISPDQACCTGNADSCNKCMQNIKRCKYPES